MDASYAQTSFLGGEWSLTAQGRFDTREYRTAMYTCFNSIPREEGPAARRPGTRHLGTTRRGLKGRTYQFAIQAAAPITVEMTDLHFRYWLGSQLVMTDDGVVVTNISTANPAVVTTATAHGWSNNNEVQFVLPATLCPLLQNRQFLITVIDATHFSLQDDLSDANIDGSTLGWALAGSPVQVTRVLDTGTLYTAGSANDWQNIRIVQAESVGVLLNGAAPYQLAYTAGTPYPTFAWTQISLIDGPYLDPVIGSTMSPSAASGTITFTQAGPLVNNGAGFTSADVGRLVRFFSEPKPWPGSGTGSAGDIVSFGGGYWIQQVGATTTPPGYVGAFPSPTQGEQTPLSGIPAFSTNANTAATPQWLPLTVAAAARWVWGTISAVNSAQQIVVTGLIGGGGGSASSSLVAVTTINTWRLGAFGGPNGYPTCGCYHEGRLWLSGAIKNRVDGSVSNDKYNFAPTLIDGTVLDSSGIAAVFNSREVNPIFWMESDDRGIICGTQFAEWLVFGSNQNNPITPTNIQAHPMTKNGCANIEPKRTENTLVVVQKYQRKILEFFADVYSGRYSAPNLSKNWKHITKPTIVELAYQQELTPVIWMRLGDGTFAGATYKRDALQTANGPDFCGGHRHALGSGWTVQSITTGSNSTGTLDALTMVTRDPSTNVYHVEQLTDMWEEGTAKSKAWFLDAAVIPTSQILTTDAGGNPVFQLNGLWHLNDKTVTAYIAGLDCGDIVVSNGTMNVPLQNDPDELLTADFVNTALNTGGIDILVGFTYTSTGQIVRPMSQQDTGARDGPGLGKKRRTQEIGIQLVDTYGISVGTGDMRNLIPLPLKQANGQAINPFLAFTGIVQAQIGDDYSYDSMLKWQVTRPFPCNVISYGGFILTQDRG